MKCSRFLLFAAGLGLASLMALPPASDVKDPQAQDWSAWLSTRGLSAPERVASAGPFALRGFGTVVGQGALWSKGVALVRFSTQSDDKATLLASKYRADFKAYGSVSVLADSPLGGGIAVQVRDAGLWVIGQRGTEVFVLSGPSADELKSYATALDVATWQKPREQAYPLYLDSFDNAL